MVLSRKQVGTVSVPLALAELPSAPCGCRGAESGPQAGAEAQVYSGYSENRCFFFVFLFFI